MLDHVSDRNDGRPFDRRPRFGESLADKSDDDRSRALSRLDLRAAQPMVGSSCAGRDTWLLLRPDLSLIASWVTRPGER